MPRETTQHHTDLEISNIDEGSGEPDCMGSAEPDVPGEPCASDRTAASDEPAKFLIAGLRPLDFVKRIAIILIGSAIFTFGVHNIHNVTGITEGGIIGLVLFGNHWFGIPPSIVSPALDCLSYAVALKVLGGGFLGWSAVATVAVAGFYRLWESLPYMLPDLTDNPLLAAVLGALFVGVGVGLVIRQGASAGGDDALALSISKITGWRVGRCYLFTDLSVLALSLTYIPVVKIAFSLITVTISSAVIDVVKDASWDHVEQFTEWLREKRRARA
ncbi:MAG: YitT family protein [Collinsella intestinalis]